MIVTEAMVVSDFPILGATALSILNERYRVTMHTWEGFGERELECPPLLVIDITTKDRDAALKLAREATTSARVVLFSLHRNEVHVYRVEQEDVEHEAEYPNLLTCVA